jgi:hypothetical protein
MTTGIIGYFASTMVLLTFVTKDMRRLRLIGILSNVAFIGYGALCWLPPVLCLHLVLLPVNVVRLVELQKTSATTIAMSMASLPAQPSIEA